MIDSNILKKRQSWSLNRKILESSKRIIEWYEAFDGYVFISFSGGKDSTVLLDLVRKIYPEVVGVFVNTGLEYPEIKSFVKSIDNIIWLKPEIPFHKIIKKYGYPVISKRISQYIYEARNTKSKYLKELRLNGYNKNKIVSKISMISKKWKYLFYSNIKISHKCCDKLKKHPLDEYVKKNNKYPIK